MFKRLLPEDRAEQTRGSATAIVYFYFWLSGIILFLSAGYGAYELTRGTPHFSVLRVVFVLIVALLCMIGAWQIGRFNRNGVMLIAAGLVVGSIGWIFELPKTEDIVFMIVPVLALIIAWQDLTPTS